MLPLPLPFQPEPHAKYLEGVCRGCWLAQKQNSTQQLWVSAWRQELRVAAHCSSRWLKLASCKTIPPALLSSDSILTSSCPAWKTAYRQPTYHRTYHYTETFTPATTQECHSLTIFR